MKRLISFWFIAMMAFSYSMANADTITMQRVSGYYSGVGGEFTVQINNNNLSPDLNWVLPYYDSKAKDIGDYDPSFQTFCLEYSEHISIGGTYNFSISDRAYLGGVGFNGDPISKGTAWLYYQFATGALGNLGYYNYYSISNGERNSFAGYLQEMIWYLEGEKDSYFASNPFYNLLLTQFGSLENALADNSGAYPVAVLNLYTLSGGLAQDQLVLVPEPATVLLLGIGLVGMAILMRRRKRTA